MNLVCQITRSMHLGVCGLTLVVTFGCCGALIRSERFVSEQTEPVLAYDSAGQPCDACDCRHILDHFHVFARAKHALLPGSMIDHRRLIPLHDGQAAQDVPHSKFHPVPTRPVFAARNDGPQMADHPLPFDGRIIPTPSADAPLELELNQCEIIPAPVEAAPINSAPIKAAPVEPAPVEEDPVDSTSEMPAEESSEEAPVTDETTNNADSAG